MARKGKRVKREEVRAVEGEAGEKAKAKVLTPKGLSGSRRWQKH